MSAPENSITVRYWAGARAAAGVDHDVVPAQEPVTLLSLRASVVAMHLARHPSGHPSSRLSQVLAVCAVLVGDQPVSSVDPGEVMVPPGAVVEFLPPFAGG